MKAFVFLDVSACSAFLQPVVLGSYNVGSTLLKDAGESHFIGSGFVFLAALCNYVH